MKYPDTTSATGPTYTTGYDTMRRPATLTDNAPYVGAVVQGVAYNAADQPVQTQFKGAAASFWENRGYNSLNQLISINGYNTSNTVVNGTNLKVTYNYSPTNNNGQIVSMTDSGIGQTVSYNYDKLNRLSSATATGSNPRTQSYTYDGFGNLTSKTGSGNVFATVPIDATTNRLAGGNFCYDGNGNLLSDNSGEAAAIPPITTTWPTA